MPDLLFELYCEELPASYLDRAIDSLRERFDALCAEQRIVQAESSEPTIVTGTPRRIVLFRKALLEQQPGQSEELTGPPVSAAFKDGKPTKAAEAFAQKLGIPVEKLEQKDTPKGKYLRGKKETRGVPVLSLLPDILSKLVSGIEFPKSMTWVPGSKLRFARPLRGIVALFGSEVVPLSWNGVESGRVTRGHPFLAPGPIELAKASFEDYEKALEKFKVVVDREKRRTGIRRKLQEAGGAFEINEKILATAANLVEWPEIMTGEFDRRFLAIPASVIRAAIEGHLRAFPLPGEGGLSNRFAFVANRPTNETIVKGNERVLAARLSDAHFFHERDQDPERSLESLAAKLGEVVFQEKLGSYAEKQARVGKLAAELATLAGWEGSKETIAKAASLMKADLLTEVVGEFPELQGEIGSEYAKKQGLPDEAASAIREAYLPRHEKDSLPSTRTGIALSVAEKLDNAVSAFATGMKPTGSKDPLGVRRQALGVLRIFAEKKIGASLEKLVASAAASLPEAALAPRKKPDPKAPPFDFAAARRALEREVLEYAKARLVNMAQESGKRADIAQAALAVGFDDVPDFWDRLAALEELSREAWFPELVTLVERTKNITKGQDGGQVQDALLREPAEKALAAALGEGRRRIDEALAARRYREAGKLYKDALASPVERFMKEVFVNDKDEAVKKNRLALLKTVHALLAERFADLAVVSAK